MNHSSRRARRARRARRGAGAVEFALASPLLLAFVLAIVDLSRYVSNAHRVTSAAVAVADLAAQVEQFRDVMDPAAIATGRELAVLKVAATEVARPLDIFDDGGALIVTSVANLGTGPTVVWRRRWGSDDIASKVGPGTMHGVALAAGEGAVFAEIGYRFRPYVLSGRLLGLDDEETLHALSVRRPRLAGPEIVP